MLRNILESQCLAVAATDGEKPCQKTAFHSKGMCTLDQRLRQDDNTFSYKLSFSQTKLGYLNVASR